MDLHVQMTPSSGCLADTSPSGGPPFGRNKTSTGLLHVTKSAVVKRSTLTPGGPSLGLGSSQACNVGESISLYSVVRLYVVENMQAAFKRCPQWLSMTWSHFSKINFVTSVAEGGRH